MRHPRGMYTCSCTGSRVLVRQLLHRAPCHCAPRASVSCLVWDVNVATGTAKVLRRARLCDRAHLPLPRGADSNAPVEIARSSVSPGATKAASHG